MFTNEPGSLQVVDGTYYNPLDFRPEDVKIDVIAHQLCLKTRWNGNTRDVRTDVLTIPVFFSVAQHSCYVHDVALKFKEKFVPGARWDLQPCPSAYGLMHDAGEGPLFDIPRPFKRTPTGEVLADLERGMKDTILDTLCIPRTGITYECVRRIDSAMIFWERDALVGKPCAPYANEFDHPGGTIHDWIDDFEPWDPHRSKLEFLARFDTLAERGLAKQETELAQ